MGQYALATSPAEAMRFFSVGKSKVYYWMKRVAELKEKPLQKHGGKRYEYFSTEDCFIIDLCVYSFLEKNCSVTRDTIRNFLQSIGYEVTLMHITRLGKRWKYSFKKPSTISINKFTSENMLRYGQYMNWVETKDFGHLKFLDESSFNAKRMFGFIQL